MANVSPAIWPGASTLPGSSTIPGQGNYPIVRVRLSFDDTVASSLPGFGAGAPTWTEVSNQKIRSWSSSRGRESELEDFDAGTASVVFDDRDRAYDPTVHSYVRPLNRIWIYEEFGGEVQSIFKGYVNSWNQEWPGGGWSDAISTAEASDEFAILALDRFQTTGTYTDQDTTGQLADTLLHPSTAHSAPRRWSLADGRDISGNSVPLTGQTPITEIRSTMGIERPDGAFFVSKAGELVLLDSAHRSSAPYDTVQMTFDDDGTDNAYLDLRTDFSDSFLFNSITVSNTTTASTAIDATSISRYFVRARDYTVPDWYEIEGIGGPVHTNVANESLAKYKAPFERVVSIVPDMLNLDTVLEIFRRELMDRIRVQRTEPGAGARFDQELFVQKIQFSGSNDGAPISCTLGVSPL